MGAARTIVASAKPGGRPRSGNVRVILKGLLYVVPSGCQWRLLPQTFDQWSLVYGLCILPLVAPARGLGADTCNPPQAPRRVGATGAAPHPHHPCSHVSILPSLLLPLREIALRRRPSQLPQWLQPWVLLRGPSRRRAAPDPRHVRRADPCAPVESQTR